MPGADAAAVSHKARSAAAAQVGTLGAGNHFLEVQVVDEVRRRRRPRWPSASSAARWS